MVGLLRKIRSLFQRGFHAFTSSARRKFRIHHAKIAKIAGKIPGDNKPIDIEIPSVLKIPKNASGVFSASEIACAEIAKIAHAPQKIAPQNHGYSERKNLISRHYSTDFALVL